MANFVIVHGGWGGGWEWTPVARLLRDRGHDVYTPTLTGLGERAHLGGQRVGLGDHVADLLAVLEFEELRDVILCGHSYGGMVVTGAADQAPDRVRLLVYLDGLVPKDGQSTVDVLPDGAGDAILGPPESRTGEPIPMPEFIYPTEGSVPEEVRRRYLARVRPHPLRTLTEPLRLTGAVDGLPRAFVRCTGEIDPEGDLMAPFVEGARAEGWHLREIETIHDLQLQDPEGTARILHELAEVEPSGAVPGRP
jgi:pimeloyl-ACP methyl ester carboxylesterase